MQIFTLARPELDEELDDEELDEDELEELDDELEDELEDEEPLEDDFPPDDEPPPLHASMLEKIMASAINFEVAANQLNGGFIKMRLAQALWASIRW